MLTIWIKTARCCAKTPFAQAAEKRSSLRIGDHHLRGRPHWAATQI